jgi:hypothetical protein
VTINLETRASDVADTLASSLDDSLQITAANAGWTHPIELVSKSGKLSLAYDEGHGDDIFNAEYGQPGISPNAVIRPFLHEVNPVIEQTIQNEALNYLFETGILP